MLELAVDAVFVEIENTVNALKAEFPSFEPANFGEFCLVDGNQGTVAAIKSEWLHTLNEIRTFFRENPDAEF